MTHVLGLDVGGTKIAGVIVDPDGRIVLRSTAPTATPDGPDAGGRVTLAVVEALLTEAREAGLDVGAIGAGYPEYVSRDGRLTSTMVLPDAHESERQLRALGLPLVIESDVRAAALAEATVGAASGASSSLYVSLGTGVSCAFTLDGAVVAGARGEALALGELDVPLRAVAGLSDAAASRAEAAESNLEGFASGAGVAMRYTARTGRRVRGASEVVAIDDDVAREVLVSAGAALGAAIASLVGVVDPEVVVLGGGLGCSGGVIVDALLESYTQRSSARPGPPPVRIAQCGPDAGVLGAAEAARRLL
ncbi:ROK family protein [Oerskovia turbata]